MRFVKQGVETGLIPLFTEDNKDRCWKIIEKAARVCYASYTMIKKEPDYEFLQRLYNNKHHSVFEHSNFVVAFTLVANSTISATKLTILFVISKGGL